MPHCLDYGVEEREEDFHKFAVLPKNSQQAVATRNVGCGMQLVLVRFSGGQACDAMRSLGSRPCGQDQHRFLRM
jgi:hypothetical protein